MGVCSAGMKPSKHISILAALILLLGIGVLGCSNIYAYGFKIDLTRALDMADRILISDIKYESGRETEKPVRELRRGTIDFNRLKKALIDAKAGGTVVKSIPDTMIVIAKGNKRILKLEYCEIDGRLVDYNKAKSRILFMPKDLRSNIK